MFDFLQGKKTYILAGLGFLTVFFNFLTGDISFMDFMGSEAMVAMIGFLGLSSLRAGVGK